MWRHAGSHAIVRPDAANTDDMISIPFFFVATAVLALLGWRSTKLSNPSHSKLGTLSLMCVFTAWLTGAVLSYLRGNETPTPADVVFSLIAVLTQQVAALVLAILCLAHWRKRPAQVRHGIGSAITAIVFVCVAFLGVLFGVVLPALRGLEGTSLGAGNLVVMPEEDFEVRAPSTAWKRMPDATLEGGDACLLLRRANPEVVACFVAETVGRMPLEQIQEFVKQALGEAFESIQWGPSSEFSSEYADFECLTFSAREPENFVRYEFTHYTTLTNGRLYQVTFTTERRTTSIDRECEELLRSFRPLGKRAPLQEEGDLVDVSRPELGFRTHLAGRGWYEWTDLDESAPTAEFGAERFDSALIVIPMAWPRGTPELDALTFAAESQLSLDFSRDGVERREWSPGADLEGFELRYRTRSDGSTWSRTLRIARSREFAWLLVAWCSPSDGLDPFLANAAELDRIELSVPKPSVGAGTSKPRTARAAPIYNDVGNWHYQRGDLDRAREYYADALQLDSHDATLLTNLAGVLRESGKAEEALARLDAADRELARNRAVRALRAQVLLELGRGDEADHVLLAALGARELDAAMLREWTTSLIERGAADEALDVAREYERSHSVLESKILVANVLADSGDAAGAVAELEPLAADPQADVELLYALGEHYNDAKAHEDAWRIGTRLLDRGERTARVHVIRGWSRMGRDAFREAKQEFETALALEPGDADALLSLEYASAALGQGSNSSIKTPVVAVTLPDELVRERDATLASAPEHEDATAVIRSSVVGIHFRAGEPQRRTLRQTVEFRAAEALAAFNPLRFRFDAADERAFVESVRVFDARGELVAEGHVDDCYVTATNDGAAGDERTLTVPLPGLAVGRRMEFVVSFESLAPRDSVRFSRHDLFGSYPIDFAAYYVVGDVDQVAMRADGTSTFTPLDGPDLHARITRAVDAVEVEAYSPPPRELAPVVWIGDERGDWADLGREYLERIADSLRIDPSVAERAAELVRDARSDAERATRLAAYVRDTITYRAASFGVRGTVPRAAHETLHRIEGDCKDQAVLLSALLKSVDVDASLVLLHSSDDLCPELPSLDQFDHMIVHVPTLGAAAFVDTTQRFCAPGTLPPKTWLGARALLLDPEEPRIVTLPKTAGPPTKLRVERSVEPSGERDLLVRETLETDGYFAELLRVNLGATKVSAREFVHGVLSARRPVRLESLEIDELAVPERPLVLRVQYHALDARTRRGDSAYASVPAPWEAMLLYSDPDPDRSNRIEITAEFEFDVRTNVAGAKLDDESASNAERRLESPFARLERRVLAAGSADSAELTLSTHATLARGEWPAASHGEFVDSRRELLDAFEARVRFDEEQR